MRGLKRLRKIVNRPTPPRDAHVHFVCNICSSSCSAERGALQREEISCPTCASNVRWRSVIAALSYALFNRYLTLDEFPDAHYLVGLGTSDWEGYAMRLRRVLAYENTYYDKEPRLDLATELPSDTVGSCDFVISSDVLEHVPPPIDAAFCNLRRLLKPGGVLILTVPMTPCGSTDEHYPDLFDYEILEEGGASVLVNRSATGETQVFRDLIFHGGEGATLEMRIFSGPDVIAALEQQGFSVEPFNWEFPRFGIVWNIPFTWPLIARVPS